MLDHRQDRYRQVLVQETDMWRVEFGPFHSAAPTAVRGVPVLDAAGKQPVGELVLCSLQQC